MFTVFALYIYLANMLHNYYTIDIFINKSAVGLEEKKGTGQTAVPDDHHDQPLGETKNV